MTHCLFAPQSRSSRILELYNRLNVGVVLGCDLGKPHGLPLEGGCISKAFKDSSKDLLSWRDESVLEIRVVEVWGVKTVKLSFKRCSYKVGYIIY